MNTFKYLPFFALLVMFLSCDHQAEGITHELTSVPGSNWLSAQRIYPHGDVDPVAIREARAFRKASIANPTFSAARGRALMPAWENIGPTNIGGRITDLELTNADNPVLLAGTAAGGIFRSPDLGVTWSPVFDDAGSLSIGDIALAPSNNEVIYVGTGEANGGGGSLTYDGDGVWRSTDGGDNWTSAGLNLAGTIGRVAVSPTDENTVLVAATGRLFANDSERGLYRTTDGGENWEQVLFVNDSTGFVDVVINPDNPDIIYAAAWQRTRSVSVISYGGAGTNLYRSVDGGDTWEVLGGGLPTSAFEKGRISLGLAPSNPSVLYAYYANANGGPTGFYRTANGGDSWTQGTDDNLVLVSFMYWFGRVVVAPDDPEVVYFSSFFNHKTTDGGDSWQDVFANVHVDQHATVVDPENPNNVFVGNDGGVYFSTDGGESFVFRSGLPITQFYNVSVDPQEPDNIFGGSQDNNCLRNILGGDDDYEATIGGDGFFSLVEPGNSDIVYAESQRGFLQKSVAEGAPGSFVTALNGIEPTDRRNWRTPYAIDPLNPNRLYYGTYRVYRSDNRAGFWSATSPDLTKGDASATRAYGTITSISPSSLVEGLVYAGTDDGKVWRSDDGGGSWTDLSAGLPDRWVTSVAASGFDPEEVYLTFSGYRFGEADGQVFRSVNRGDDWTVFGEDLPDVPVNEIVIDPDNGRMFLATDIGVFLRFRDGEVWELLTDGIPNVVVSDLEYHPPTQRLIAGTYGRSVFRLDTEELVSAEELPAFVRSLTLFPNPATDRVNLLLEVDEPLTVSLSLLDVAGRTVRGFGERRMLAGNSETEITVSGLKSGMYFLRGTSAAGSFVKRVTIR